MPKEGKSLSMRSATIKTVEEAKCLKPMYDFSYRVDCIITDWAALMNFTKIELINRFSEVEVGLMLDATSGLILTSQLSPILILHGNVADYMKLNGKGAYPGVDEDILLEKLLNLTAHQSYVTLQLCQEYWNNEDPYKVDVKKLFMIRE